MCSVSFVPLALVALALAPHAAQEPEPARPQPPVPIPVGGNAQDDVQRQMLELFGKVESQMRAIDKLLQEASRDDARQGNALAERLRAAQTSGEAVRRDIDRILELAAQQQQQQSSSGGQGQPQDGQGQSPLDRQGEQSTGREATPSTPQPGSDQPQPGGEQQRPQGERPGEQPDDARSRGEQGRNPKDGPQRSDADPSQQKGNDPARGGQGAANPARDGRDRWGDLPVHAREVFRNEGGQDMPPLYREWIDAYYKRLSRDG